MVGWGATQSYGPAETRLRQARVELVSPEDCSRDYQVESGATELRVSHSHILPGHK